MVESRGVKCPAPARVQSIEQDPEVIPDVDIAAQVGKDFFLDEEIPRHESGQGYVRVVEKSIMWRETETAKVFTYQGLTTCTELHAQTSDRHGFDG